MRRSAAWPTQCAIAAGAEAVAAAAAAALHGPFSPCPFKGLAILESQRCWCLGPCRARPQQRCMTLQAESLLFPCISRTKPYLRSSYRLGGPRCPGLAPCWLRPRQRCMRPGADSVVVLGFSLGLAWWAVRRTGPPTSLGSASGPAHRPPSQPPTSYFAAPAWTAAGMPVPVARTQHAESVRVGMC
jgi:hypothetical protein